MQKSALVIGENSKLGKGLTNSLMQKSFKVTGTTHKITSIKPQNYFLDLLYPTTFNNLPDFDVAYITAGINNIEVCEKFSEFSYLVNVTNTLKLIEKLSKHCDRVYFFSSNCVFHGMNKSVSVEASHSPINNYGKQKAKVENYIIDKIENCKIIRLSKVFDETAILPNFITNLIKSLSAEKKIETYSNFHISPIGLKYSVEMIINNIHNLKDTIYQISAISDISYLDIAHHVANVKQLKSSLIIPKKYINREYPEIESFYSSLLPNPIDSNNNALTGWNLINEILANHDFNYRKT